MRGRVGGVALSLTDLLISPCIHGGSNDAAELRGSFQVTASRKTSENTAKHRDGGVGSVVANDLCGGDSSVVVTTLVLVPKCSDNSTTETALSGVFKGDATRPWHLPFEVKPIKIPIIFLLGSQSILASSLLNRSLMFIES